MNALTALVDIANNPSTRDWVRKLIPELIQKDCVDVARDLEMLADLFSKRADAINKFHSR